MKFNSASPAFVDAAIAEFGRDTLAVVTHALDVYARMLDEVDVPHPSPAIRADAHRAREASAVFATVTSVARFREGEV